MYKKCKVIMLPTKNLTNISLNKELGLAYMKIPCTINTDEISNQHLYITSDEEIKEGDWCINLAHKIVIKPTDIEWANSNYDNLKKIISTNDSSLTIDTEMDIHSIPTQHIEEDKVLPQPSQTFIKKYVEDYNEGNVITDVLVEHLRGSDGYYDENDNWHWKILGVKVNPKNNTINIKKIKDSWSREEVIAYGYWRWYDKKINGGQEKDAFNRWIKENL